MKIFNLNGNDWDRTEERAGWKSKDAWVGHHVGAELIGGSMYELEPGDRLWPFHTHHANEEGRSSSAERPRFGRTKASSRSARVTSPASPEARTARTRSGTTRTSRSAS